MLALLLAPRGRISAARMAAQVRKRREAEARRSVIRLPRVPAADDSRPIHRANDADSRK